MAETFLVGVDGSEGGQRAVDFATARAKSSGASIVIAYVIEWSPYSFMTPEELEERHKQHDEEIAKAKTQVIDALVAAVHAQGMQVKGVVRHGHAAEALCQIAKEEKATQLFVGRRGISKLKAMLFGSISGSLVQISPIPVTVVP